MASLRLLLLLLVMCLLLVLTMSESTTEKNLKKMKEAFKIGIDHLDEIREAVNPLLSLIKDSGPGISAAVNLVLFIITGTTKEDKVLKAVVDEFQSLNFKLDQYHVEQRWDSWASGAYHKPEMDIEVAWTSFFTLLGSLVESADEQTKQRHLDEFLTSYQTYEPATKILQKLLTAKETTFINNLGQMLAEHTTCHPISIREYAVFLDTLFIKGNMLNQIYYHLKKISSQARINEAAQIQYDFQTAMFQLHKYCASAITDYVKKDVEGQIDQIKTARSSKNEDLAKDIRSHLEKTHYLYEWMVVAFKTKNSERFFKILNKHTLTGFTPVKREEVSVAVAQQSKGKHTMAGDVKKTINQCFEKTPLCYKVEEILHKCNKTVGDVPLSQTYTAVHAFHGNAHESHTDIKPDDNYDEYDKEVNVISDKDYIHSGECWIFVLFSTKPFKGKYQVMIKSDEAIKNNTCSKLECGGKNRGQCVAVGVPPVPMCECNHPYYGMNCEKTIEDYKKQLEISLEPGPTRVVRGLNRTDLY